MGLPCAEGLAPAATDLGFALLCREFEIPDRPMPMPMPMPMRARVMVTVPANELIRLTIKSMAEGAYAGDP